jgi:ribosomal protein L11 methyltransferase
VDELDALSVSVEDADAGTDAEQALFGEPGMPAPKRRLAALDLKALFETRPPPPRPPPCCWRRTGPPTCTCWPCSRGRPGLGAADAVQFAPVEITPSFWIVPSWHEPRQARREVIRLDPGLAFGTGTHPTTRMCLRWIGAARRPLAPGWSACWTTAAARASWPSARRCMARAALTRSTSTRRRGGHRANAQANGVTLTAGLPERAQRQYPLVLANILATPLKLLAPLLAGHVAPGGHLVLAGILERQADELKAAYAPWLALGVADTEDGWILMTARRELPCPR